MASRPPLRPPRERINLLEFLDNPENQGVERDEVSIADRAFIVADQAWLTATGDGIEYTYSFRSKWMLPGNGGYPRYQLRSWERAIVQGKTISQVERQLAEFREVEQLTLREWKTELNVHRGVINHLRRATRHAT